jgi:hypothetical protein
VHRASASVFSARRAHRQALLLASPSPPFREGEGGEGAGAGHPEILCYEDALALPHCVAPQPPSFTRLGPSSRVLQGKSSTGDCGSSTANAAMGARGERGVRRCRWARPTPGMAARGTG